MTHFRVGLAGGITGFALSLAQVMLFAETTSPFLHYGWWMWLMGGAVGVCAVAGGVLALCVSAYRDTVAEATGYCRPVREKVR